MLAETYDIQAYKNASLNLSLTIYTDDDATTLLNLTGYTATLTVRDKPGGSTIATLTSGSGLTLGGSAGTIVIAQTSTQTAAWKLDVGAYDLTITTGTTTTLLLKGQLELVTT